MARDMGRDITGDVAAQQETSLRTVEGGSIIEAAAGIGTAVLAILALAGLLSMRLTEIATIVIGVGLLAQGAAIASRYSRLMSHGRGNAGAMEFGGGMTAELIGGAAAVVLGILALIGVSSTPLMAIAAIVLGSALLLGSGIASRLSAIEVGGYNLHVTAQHAAREAVLASAGAQMLVGVGAIVLGVLALIGINPLTLIQVALLALGVSVLMSGSAVSGRMMSMMR